MLRALARNTPFALALTLLVLTTAGAFVLPGALAWGAGLLYIAYDTWLLFFVAWKTRRPAAAAPEPPRAPRTTLAVLISARNESAVLPACLAALEAQTDRPDEVHVVDDGSTDGTAERLKALGLPRLRVWEKPHTGKADSLNAVWPETGAVVVVTIDADTLLEPGAIAAMRRAFAADPELAAACGILTPKCPPTAAGWFFELFQTFEYLRAFLARLAWMRADSLLLVSGAFAAYRKDVLKELGGYDPRSLVEDYDLIHRLQRRAWEAGRRMKVAVVVEARAVTDAPAGVRAFLKQRQRWFAGFLATQFKNGDMIGNPRYGPVGTLMLPIKAVDTLQPIYGLTAFFILLGLLASRQGLHRDIVVVLIAKLLLDIGFHYRFIVLYHRWQGRRPPGSVWPAAALASALEPVSFQLLRHAGAVLGWAGFLSGHNDWAPQRPVPQGRTAVGGIS